MSSETIAVLALDGADLRLAQRWGCENILLDDHGALETFAHSKDVPLTIEVWPTIATGKHPADHDVTDDPQRWENPALRAVSTITRHLPVEWRRLLGKPFRDRGGLSFKETADSHVFEDGCVWGWPGITPANHLEQAWDWMDALRDGDLSKTDLEDRMTANTGREFGWLRTVSQTDTPIVGVHSHVLDLAGHVYAEQPSELRYWYKWVDRELKRLRTSVDRLVVLSDHGMQTVVHGDGEPGQHSWHSLVASQGVDGPLPESVVDVRRWLTAERPAVPTVETRQEVGVPEEHLRDLGYLS